MSIANYLTALDAQRDQLARNLTAMGVQASESEKLNTLVPKVLQIPSGRPEETLFHSGNDALATYGESIYTFYNDGYRSLSGFAETYPNFCSEENGYALYYNQGDFNWGSVIASLFGGWDSALVTLIIFMGVDFATGLITGAMGKSKHSKSGKLNSKAGWYGLAKKCSILMLIIVAVRLDILLNTNYVRDAVCIGFCVNELLSIVENTSLMGIPYPPALKNAIEVLQKQTGRKDDDDD